MAGIIDEGETAETAARREAMEEAGVRLGALEPVGEVWTTPGISTERMSLYLAPYAAADRVGIGGGVQGEHENIKVLELPLAGLGAELAAGRIGDMKLLRERAFRRRILAEPPFHAPAPSPARHAQRRSGAAL